MSANNHKVTLSQCVIYALTEERTLIHFAWRGVLCISIRSLFLNRELKVWAWHQALVKSRNQGDFQITFNALKHCLFTECIAFKSNKILGYSQSCLRTLSCNWKMLDQSLLGSQVIRAVSSFSSVPLQLSAVEVTEYVAYRWSWGESCFFLQLCKYASREI